MGIAVYDIPQRRYSEGFVLGYPPGTMMAVGRHHVMTFFQHPRLVSLDSGRVVHQWSEIDCGEAASCIVHDQSCPILALAPARARFAIGTPDGVSVVTLDPGKLPQ